MSPKYIVWNPPAEESKPLSGLLGQLAAEDLSRNAGWSNAAPCDSVALKVKGKRDNARADAKAGPDDGTATNKVAPWDRSADGGGK
jgi:hypothetical protein